MYGWKEPLQVNNKFAVGNLPAAFLYFELNFTYYQKGCEIMNQMKIGKQSFRLEQKPVIKAWASVAGKKESEGPLGKYFDITSQDAYFGQKTWEQGERKMQQIVLNALAQKAEITPKDFGLVLSGDLLNQCIGSSFSLKNMNIPHLGLYGACSTMAEGMLIGSMIVGGGFSDQVVAMTSSHFASSERQYRFPLNYGGQRPQTAQWTVTGSGAVLLCQKGKGPVISAGTIGTVVDLGIQDANNMGAAMAPAAHSTIISHFCDFGVDADYFDLIVTGDLGQLGKDILIQLCSASGLSIGGKIADCGSLVFDNTKQDVHSGGSGCGCSAITLCGYLLNKIQSGEYKRILFCGTGALLSPTSIQQGLPIAGVCHAVVIEGGNS